MKHLIFALIGAILTVQSAVAADKKLTISVYSFAQDAYKKTLYDPFEAICDCELVIKLVTVSSGWLKSKPMRPIT